ncbi:hypothetical protein [Streptomyces sp. NPDC005423]|uniref:hypothetical protein n=1 Tax=Streptomyces sp. NPDC005423 TaxID=3155343 RepID=UPI0033AFBC0D
MSWTRGLPAVLAVCALLSAGSAGCGSGEAHGRDNGPSASPVGKVLEDTDEGGRHYREVDEKSAPEIGIEVAPVTAAADWDVRLTVHGFRLSPAGTAPKAVAGRGTVRLLVDGRTVVARLRASEYDLPGALVPHGTHHVTARLYADDGTVWAVHGKPVQSTADITASESQATPDGSGTGAGTGR